MAIILFILLCFQYSTSFSPIRYYKLPKNVFLSNALATSSDVKIDSQSSLLQWLEMKGAKKDEILISTVEKSNKQSSCIARNAIKKGNVILSVPLDVCLNVDKAGAKFSSSINSKDLRTGDIGLLALSLLYEKSLGQKSQFYEYINSLPEVGPGILSWDQEELEVLKRSTSRRINLQIEAVLSDFNTLRNMKLPLFPSNYLTKELFTWAVCIVKARCIYLERKPNLIPGVDCLAFDPMSTSEATIASGNLFATKVVKVLSERDYEAGEEVVMSYGFKSSAECLEDHGIVPDFTEEDSSCELVLSIESTDSFPEDKIDVLEAAGLSGVEVFDLDTAEGGQLDMELMRFLRLKMISGKDSFILEACFRDSIYETMEFPFSQPNEIAALQKLQSICRGILATLGAGSEDDLSPEAVDAALVERVGLEGGGEGEHESRWSMMARLRIQERAVLRGTIAATKLELSSLINGPDTREYYQERRLMSLNLLRPLDESEIFLPGERGLPDDRY